MKLFASLATLAITVVSPCVNGATTIQNFSFNVNSAIPDGNPSGLADLQSVTTTITEIEAVTLSLDISGSYNGDLYAYVQHSSGFAILLNRVGRTSVSPFGFSDDGFQITLNDSGAFADIHNQTSSGSLLTGTFASDGRNVDPDLVIDTDPRTANLNGFNGLDPNGEWVLFIADVSGGESHTLNGWSMQISGVPEPGTLWFLLMSATLLGRRRR